MSLSSLKKSKPSVSNKAPVSVESFIDQAVSYANGERIDTTLSNVVRMPDKTPGGPHKKMRRATFTLDEKTIEKLTLLSEQTGTARSKLIRLWVEQAMVETTQEVLLQEQLY